MSDGSFDGYVEPDEVYGENYSKKEYRNEDRVVEFDEEEKSDR